MGSLSGSGGAPGVGSRHGGGETTRRFLSLPPRPAHDRPQGHGTMQRRKAVGACEGDSAAFFRVRSESGTARELERLIGNASPPVEPASRAQGWCDTAKPATGKCRPRVTVRRCRMRARSERRGPGGVEPQMRLPSESMEPSRRGPDRSRSRFTSTLVLVEPASLLPLLPEWLLLRFLTSSMTVKLAAPEGARMRSLPTSSSCRASAARCAIVRSLRTHMPTNCSSGWCTGRP